MTKGIYFKPMKGEKLSTEGKKIVDDIRELAKKLVNEEGLAYSEFLLAHNQHGCETREDVVFIPRTFSGGTQMLPGKKRVCDVHNISSLPVYTGDKKIDF